MRQSGILAAGALYALENNIPGLAHDHANAHSLGAAVDHSPGLSLDPEVIDTNIVIFKLDETQGDAGAFCQRLYDEGVWMLPFSQRHVRAVTHRDVSAQQCIEAGQILQRVAESHRTAKT